MIYQICMHDTPYINDDIPDMYAYHKYVWYHVPWGVVARENIHPIEPTFIQVMDTHTYPAIIIHIWLSSYKSVISFIQIRLSSYKSVISFMQIRLSSYKSGFHRTGGGYLHCFSIVFRMQVVAYHHTFPAIIQICHIIHTFLAINRTLPFKRNFNRF